jgi:hypothetical protein
VPLLVSPVEPGASEPPDTVRVPALTVTDVLTVRVLDDTVKVGGLPEPAFKAIEFATETALTTG